MSLPIIAVNNLSKVYQLGSIGATSLKDELGLLWNRLCGREKTQKKKEFWALRDISFEVQPGEVIAIIGRNGAGKSTLLKILSRITQQTSGKVILRGRFASLLEVGTGFHPDLTGRENIFLNGAILGMTKGEIRRKFDEIVAFAEVEKFIDTPVKRYSSGMYVRLAFAVAAHLEPDILIVDEVLAVGDIQFQKKCLGKMQDVSTKEGRTVLFVSHNMTAVAALCHRAIWLRDGQVVLDGPTAEVTGEYQTASIKNVEDGSSLITALRTGNGAARFMSVSIQCVNNEGQSVPLPYSGCDLIVDTEIEAEQDVNGALIALIIYDGNASRLIDVNTSFKGESLDMAAGTRSSIHFVLHDILLASGTYYLGLWIGRQGLEAMDHIEIATSFRVIDDPDQTKHVYNFPGRYRCRFDTSISKSASASYNKNNLIAV